MNTVQTIIQIGRRSILPFIKNIKLSRLFCVILLVAVLTQCNKSIEPTYYTLTPIHLKSKTPHNQHTFRIGIDMVSIPEYLDSPYLKIFTTANQAQLLEMHQWAGALDITMGRVIQTNLATYLPHAAIQMAPWDTEFYPDYHLHVDITQFNVDMHGNSILQAIYTIEKNKNSVAQYQAAFYEKLTTVTPHTIVDSMNNQLRKLTEHIATHFRHTLRQ